MGEENILQFLKNGSGIHIKEKNKGSFTRWCRGNVTEECIRRGKASKNPKIRKKAVFADNARHFKHRLGGNIRKMETGNSISLDAYYAKRAAEEQNLYYLQGSRNRKESYPVFLSMPYTKEDEDRDRRSVEIAVKGLHRDTGIPIAEIYDRLNNGTLYGTEQLQGDKYYNSAARLIINTANRVISKKHEPIAQPNCIATATSNNPNKGHFVTGNLSFAANPRKFGFTKVNKESAKPGSLVQIVYGNTPTHAMILDSNNDGVEKFNYSPGNYPEYKTNASYPVGSRYGTHLDYYNFVGNEADSARWKKEYDEIYSRKSGGILKAQKGEKVYESDKILINKNLNTISNIAGTAVNGISSIVGSILKLKSANNLIKANNLKDLVSLRELIAKYLLEEMERLQKEEGQYPGINSSPIVNNYVAYLRALLKALAEIANLKNLTAEENAKILQEALSDLTNSIMGTVGNLASTGIGLLSNKAPFRKNFTPKA